MLFRSALLTALLVTSAPILAQAGVQPFAASDADRLAEQVRRLGADPRDLDALLTAAALSVRLDDLSAAGAFLARAEKVSPPTARGQAVKAAILVRSERPGEALRLFAQAEGMGAAPASLAADRGLAYDLIGEQRRAQADYRVALKGGDDDEVRRRLALSLGIAGRQREALDELAPLVRRNDRGAWRSRAFILAMNGDTAEALRIAQTMMPPGSAQGLQGFFAELPRLPAIDRAFAVHFGEVRGSPQRLADARLAPQLAALPAEPAPVQVAAVAPTPAPMRRKGKHGSMTVTFVPLPAKTVVAAAEPVGPPPAYQAPTYAAPAAQTPFRTPVIAANTADRPLTPGEQASLAAATLPSARRRGRAAAPPVQVASAPVPASRPPVQVAAGATRAAPAPSPGFDLARVTAPISAVPQPEPVMLPPATPAAAVRIAAASPGATSAANAPAAAAPVAQPSTASPRIGLAAAAPIPSPSGAAVPSPPVEPAPGAAPPVASPPVEVATSVRTPPPVAAAIAPVARPAVPARLSPRVSRAQADGILARIVANLSIPASELGIGKPAPGGRTVRGAARPADAPPPSAADKKLVADAKRAADKKALADRKAAAEKKALAEKDAAERKAARAEPARIWVQVAGGANPGDLAKAWGAAKAKAPAAFAGRKGYTTPLRATNRVLTGPFKTDAEARAYVNQLAKSGVSAFSFTSEAGQKVSRLNAK